MRYKNAKKVSILGIIGNIFLFVIKIIVGIIANSKAMIADSLNSFSDIFASIMTYIGNKISSVPNDNDHSFGHGKAEYIFSMLIGISMMSIAVKLLYDSTLSIINNNIVSYSLMLIIICIVTIITKLGLYLYSRYIYQKHDNLLVKSNMLDHRNDIFVTSLTLVAIIFSKYHIYWIDGVVGIGISIWIFIVGVKIYKESYDVLMDTSLDNQSKLEILNIIREDSDIKRIGEIYSIPIGYKYIVVLTILVDGRMHTAKSHRLASEIESKILKKILRVENVIVHVEPFSKKK